MNENNFPLNENEELEQQEMDQQQQAYMIHMERRRRRIFVLRLALIAVLFLTAILIVAILVDKSAKQSQALAEKRQMQNEYNRLLLKAETDLRLDLRPFTPEEEAAMLSGERAPQEVVDAIVEECATPEPEFSGKTQDEVIAYYNDFLSKCQSSFLSEIDQLINEAKAEWPEAKKADSGKNNWLTKYTAQINTIEARVDKEFDGYMESMRSDLKSIDGSLDDDDLAIVSSFYARYAEEKERTVKRFTQQFSLSAG